MAPLFLLANALADQPSDLGIPDIKLADGLPVILQLVFMAAGLLSVIFIIVGGIKYTLSGGDAAGIKSAKETITYAIVGLIVTFLAFGIVNFVTKIGA